MRKKIAVIGLGKLGLPLAISIASRGFCVNGVDLNKASIESVNRRCSTFYEQNLKEYLKKYGKNLTATQDIVGACEDSEIIFIIVPTPSMNNGKFSTNFVQAACETIGKGISNKKEYKLISLVSTVTPQACKEEIIPVLEKFSNKKCGIDFGFCYNPEFIALGSVIKNLLNPDLVLIGEYDKRSGDILEKFYKAFCTNNPVIKRMNIVNAEITKISLNCFVTTKISFANFLAEICENIPGGNVDDISEALGCDTRIGRKYLRGGLGYGGSCFPRDNKAMQWLCSDIRVASSIPRAVDVVNKTQVKRLTRILFKKIKSKENIGIFGLSYKPETAVTEESQGILLANVLAEKYMVWVSDPQAIENAKLLLGKKVNYANSIKCCFNHCTVIIITTPWSIYSKELMELIKKTKKNIVLFDCWRIYPANTFKNNVKHIRLGEFVQ